MFVIDFETEEIQPRPYYPPKPVGVAIMDTTKPRASKYYAWGHPSGNNCSKAEAVRALKSVWGVRPLIFHNGKFDVDVAEVHLGLRRLSWDMYHDTMFLLFLDDPHSRSLELKPAAERLLDMPPEERDAVRQWLVDNKVCRSNDKKWGRFISKAPGDLVGRYAAGDVVRTYRLFKLLHKSVVDRGMGEAYDRERYIMPMLLDNEREGILVDDKRLEADTKLYEAAFTKADQWIRKRLKVSDLNVDSDVELADALHKSRIVTDWEETETGKRSTSKKTMTPDKFSDKRVYQVLAYRSRLATCLSTFLRPWLLQAQEGDGRIHTSWNQVRNAEAGYSGTRTGRPSSKAPNFLNVPKSFEGKDDGYEHPAFLNMPELPLTRVYLLPDKGHTWLHRDYNQQEIRILAHFENGLLMDKYNEEPRMDVHEFVRQVIKEISGIELHRRETKIVNFGMIYGMGIEGLCQKLKCSPEYAQKIKRLQLTAVPGLKELSKDIKDLAKSGMPITTWGGRQYYPEPSREINGEVREFIYKLLNYLIQGSAADVTKQALVNYNEIKKEGRFLVTVYDENNISAPKGAAKREMQLLREAMEGVEMDVPMLSDGKWGRSWGELEKFKEK